MATQHGSQALCGPFLPTDLPDFQAACVHFDQHWLRFLSTTEQEFVKAIMYRTARIGLKYRKRRIPIEWFFDGHLGNDETGYAGCPSMVRVSEKTFYKVRNDLVSYGIVVYDGDTYAIDYSINALHLAEIPAVQRRVLAANRRGGMLSTIEGIMEWAKHCVSLMIRANIPSRERGRNDSSHEKKSYGYATCQNGKPATNSESLTENQSQKTSDTRGETNCSNVIPIRNSSTSRCRSDLPYRVSPYKTHVISSDKSSDICAGETDMTAKELMARLAEMEAKRQAVRDKRKSRATLPDLCNLFEEGWRTGQKERDASIMPARLVSRDRALLKSQIIGPARDAGIDVQDFANWCALNWDGIGATFFKKAKSYPSQPAFAWFVRCLETYSSAYAQRDGLDLSGLANPSHRVSTQAVAAISATAEKAVSRATDAVADLQAQLREAREDNERLRRAKALPIDDDPVYARASKLAARKITIGSYDEEAPAAPVRRKLTRHRK